MAPNLWLINGDATQLHQVLLNLCVNARDAMPNGGCLKIEATNIELDGTIKRAESQPSGRYILLTAADTGHGMTPEILAKVFEPFFTTKEIGKGTGLGLSTLMGIVKTHGGFVEVSSEVGKACPLFRALPGRTLPVIKVETPVGCHRAGFFKIRLSEIQCDNTYVASKESRSSHSKPCRRHHDIRQRLPVRRIKRIGKLHHIGQPGRRLETEDQEFVPLRVGPVMMGCATATRLTPNPW